MIMHSTNVSLKKQVYVDNKYRPRDFRQECQLQGTTATENKINRAAVGHCQKKHQRTLWTLMDGNQVVHTTTHNEKFLSLITKSHYKIR